MAAPTFEKDAVASLKIGEQAAKRVIRLPISLTQLYPGSQVELIGWGGQKTLEIGTRGTIGLTL